MIHLREPNTTIMNSYMFFLIKYDHITTSRKEHILTKLQSRTDDFSLFYDRYV